MPFIRLFGTTQMLDRIRAYVTSIIDDFDPALLLYLNNQTQPE